MGTASYSHFLTNNNTFISFSAILYLVYNSMGERPRAHSEQMHSGV